MTPAVGLGGLGQARNLGVGQVFRVRSSALARRRGVTVRFWVAGDTSLRRGFAMKINLPRNETVRRIKSNSRQAVMGKLLFLAMESLKQGVYSSVDAPRDASGFLKKIGT